MAATGKSERRRYWLSLAALAIVLPAAIVVNSWDSLSEWRAAASAQRPSPSKEARRNAMPARNGN